jgi:hypothetical protein
MPAGRLADDERRPSATGPRAAADGERKALIEAVLSTALGVHP